MLKIIQANITAYIEEKVFEEFDSLFKSINLNEHNFSPKNK